MKKVLYAIFIVMIMTFVVACEGGVTEDPAQTKLNQTHESIGQLISNPNSLTEDFKLPTLFENGVAATWESTDTSVLTVGLPDSNNEVSITINRPTFNEVDKELFLKYVLSIDAENEEKVLKKSDKISLTVKAFSAPVISNVFDVLSLKDDEYSPADDGKKISITLNNLTVFAKSTKVSYVYDGTGVIVVKGNHDQLILGSVYDVTGLLEWNLGSWELVSSKVAPNSSSAKTPAKETISDVEALVTDLESEDVLSVINGTPSLGNLEPMYVNLTGQVYQLSSGELVIAKRSDNDEINWNLSSNNFINKGFVVNKDSVNYDSLNEYLGYEVVINALVSGYDASLNGLLVLFTGDDTSIEFGYLTNEQKANLDLKEINIPQSVTETTNLNLNKNGTQGSTITWTTSNPELINLETGKVSMSTNPIRVSLTYTLKNGEVTITNTLYIVIGDVGLLTIAEAKDASLDALVKVQGVYAGRIDEEFFILLNGENGIALKGNPLGNLSFTLGDLITVVGVKDEMNGLEIIADYEVLLVEAGELPASISLNEELLDATNLNKYQSMLVNLNNMVVKSVTVNDDILLTLESLDGRTISLKWDHNTSANSTELDLAVGDIVDLNNLILGWYDDAPLLMFNELSSVNEIEEKLSIAIGLFTDLELQSSFDDNGELELHKRIVTTDVLWAYGVLSDENNSYINLETGAVTVPESGTVNVLLTATININGFDYTREFSIELNSRPPLMFDFDFTDESDVANNVSRALRETVVTNAISSTPFTFWRENTIIGKRSTALRGIVLYMSKEHQNTSSLTYTDFKVNGLKKVELSIGNWGLDAISGIDAIAESINLETSTDGINWNVVKDLKPEWITNSDHLNQFTVSISNPLNEGLYVRIIVNGKTDTTYTGNLRLILTNIKFFTKE